MNSKALSGLALLCGVLAASGAAPTADYVFPAGGQQGTTAAVTLGGKFDTWPAQIWTDCQGLDFKAGKNKGEFEVRISKDAPAGPHLVRVFNAEGAAGLKTFVVGRWPEVSDREPNDGCRQHQAIEQLPVTINGRLDKGGDVDSFAVRLKAGQWLVAAVQGYGLGSPMDPYLHLLDSHGTQLALGNDSANLDPFLAFRVEQDGTYIVQLMAFVHPPQAEVRFSGGNSSVYRLTLTSGPWAGFAFPAGVQRGRKTSLQLFGWNLGSTNRFLQRAFDASRISPGQDFVEIADARIQNSLRLPASDLPEQIEAEPNNTASAAQSMSVPGVMNGRLNPARDEDRFKFAAKQGERLEIRACSASLGFPADPVLKLEDGQGKQLGRDDDGGQGPDAKLVWTAPADGSYVASVADLFHKGGEDYVYRLEVDHARPAFKAAIESDALRIEAGKTAEIKIKVTRVNDHKGELLARVKHLPPGVTVPEVKVPEKGGEVKLVLTATADAKPANGPIQIEVAATDPKDTRVWRATRDLKDKDARGDLLISETDQVWLTVVPAAPEKPKVAAKKK